jgi:hypothetical protein
MEDNLHLPYTEAHQVTKLVRGVDLIGIANLEMIAVSGMKLSNERQVRINLPELAL